MTITLHLNLFNNDNNLKQSLEKLSSGLRINKAADDAGGLVIADSLRAQANTINQSIKNANDGMGLMNVADGATREQIKILDTIKTKAIQAAQSGQTKKMRQVLQNDINKLLKELDNIAINTKYNGESILSGEFTNKVFQIGNYSHTSVKTTINATSSDKIGLTRFETGALAAQEVSSTDVLKSVKIKLVGEDGGNDLSLKTIAISTSAGTGIGALAEIINRSSDKTGIKATWSVKYASKEAIKADTYDITINGVKIGAVDVKDKDEDGSLVDAINSFRGQTGVEASIDKEGRLILNSVDGRAIDLKMNDDEKVIVGRLTLIKHGAKDILVSGTNLSVVGMADSQNIAQTSVNLRSIRGGFNANIASAIGANENLADVSANANGISAGVTTLKGALAVMDIAQSALNAINEIRAEIGSVQNKFKSALSNLYISYTTIKSSESQIRDVDFASESANFRKYNLLAQSGSFAMSQANTNNENIIMLLKQL
jgi:flagellin